MIVRSYELASKLQLNDCTEFGNNYVKLYLLFISDSWEQWRN